MTHLKVSNSTDLENATRGLIRPEEVRSVVIEALDLVVDPKSRELRVNPESPDMPLLDLMHVA